MGRSSRIPSLWDAFTSDSLAPGGSGRVRRAEALLIPAQHAPDGEGVSKAVQRQRRHTIGDGKLQARRQPVEDLADGLGVDAAAAVEAEQRSVGFSGACCPAAFHVRADELGDPRHCAANGLDREP